MVGPRDGEVVCHNDLFWPNVIVDGTGSGRDRLGSRSAGPVSTTSPRRRTSGCAAAGRPVQAWGSPRPSRRAAPALCDGYGLDAPDGELLDARREDCDRLATYRRWGATSGAGLGRDVGSRPGRYLVARPSGSRRMRLALAGPDRGRTGPAPREAGPARPRRERRTRGAAVGTDMSERSVGATSATRSTSCRPVGPGSPALLAVVEREPVASSSRSSTSRGSPRTATVPRPGARLQPGHDPSARTTRPRRTPSCTASGCPRPRSAA